MWCNLALILRLHCPEKSFSHERFSVYLRLLWIGEVSMRIAEQDSTTARQCRFSVN